MSKRNFHRIVWVVAAALCLLVPAPAVRAADGDYGLSVVAANRPYYIHDRWMPMRAMITNRTDREIRGHVVLPIKGEDNTVTFRMPVVLPPKSNCTFTANIYVPPQPTPVPKRRGDPTPQPPICIAWLEDSGGAQLVRSEMLGRVISEGEKQDKPNRPAVPIPLSRPLILAVADDVSAEEPEDEQANNTGEFADQFQAANGLPVFAQALSTADLPRSLAAYDMVGLIILSNVQLDKIDAAQRQALLDFMSSGGILLLAAPRGPADPTGTWLSPYLPAAYVGQRYATSITLNGATTRPTVPLDIAEFVKRSDAPAGSAVVASDDRYVHLAYTPVGFGRLVVSAIPVTGVNVTQAEIRNLWQQALHPPQPVLSWDRSRMPAQQAGILQSMVGLKAPPWAAAAAIVAAYVLIVLVIQLVARQGLRPTGFAAAIGVAILLAGGLLVISLFKDTTVELNFARISLTDLDNGGVRQEAVALLGEHKEVVVTAVPGAVVRDEIGGKDDVTVVTSPPGVKTMLSPRQLGRIWRATAAVAPGQSLQARGQFDADGFKLNIDNAAAPVEGTLLLTESRHFSLADVPTGESAAAATEQNLNPASSPPINQKAAVQLEQEQLRGRIMDAALRPAPSAIPPTQLSAEPAIQVAGWYTQPPPPLVTLAGEEQAKLSRTNAMVRSRVRLEPSPVGSTVRINGAFSRILNGFGATLPYDTNSRQWIEQFTAPQEFQVGFAVPSGIGKIRPTRVTLLANFNAAQHTVTVRRGQCPGGKLTMTSTGPEIATWTRPIAPQQVTFDVAPGDYDANGWVWLQFSIEVGEPGQARWQINDMSMSYEATVEGAPAVPVMPEREAMIPAAAPPRKLPAKQAKPAEKKPQRKPTTKPAAKKDATKK